MLPVRPLSRDCVEDSGYVCATPAFHMAWNRLVAGAQRLSSMLSAHRLWTVGWRSQPVELSPLCNTTDIICSV